MQRQLRSGDVIVVVDDDVVVVGFVAPPSAISGVLIKLMPLKRQQQLGKTAWKALAENTLLADTLSS